MKTTEYHFVSFILLLGKLFYIFQSFLTMISSPLFFMYVYIILKRSPKLKQMGTTVEFLDGAVEVMPD